MPEWLRQAGMVESPLSAGTMAGRLLISALAGAVIAAIYRASHGRQARDSQTLIGTLVLLTILLSMVTMVIGDSVARAFGLVGALSIVRFRTVVEDTRDTAFVIFAVVVGMAVGTGLVLVAAIGVPVVAAAALALSARNGGGVAAAIGAGSPNVLSVRLGVGQPAGPVEAVLSGGTRSWRLMSVATARQGAAMDLSYAVDVADATAAMALVSQLNATAGVQGVDYRSGVRAD